jgi:signal transduction histidine kinase/CheY-like chemotaxis protein
VIRNSSKLLVRIWTFIEEVKKLVLSPESIQRNSDIKIVYTPIHGTGGTLVPDALKAVGFTNIIHVPEQDVISGDFPTVVSPNPEEPAALDLAIKKARETDADLVMATDPDSDRIGTAIRDDKGEFILVNGNQTLLLCLYYLMTRREELGLLTGKEFIVKTIVSTELAKVIAQSKGIEIYDSYTGFKWIADIIRKNEGIKKYIGGGEESYGFLAGDFVRDKDAVSACTLFAEIAAWARDHGKSVYELLQDIYLEYGYSKEVGISLVKKGKEGAEEIEAMMKNFRAKPLTSLGGSPVTLIKDFGKLDLRRQREIHTDLIRRQEVMSQTNRMLTSQIDELLKNIEHEEIKKSLLLISERSRAISRSQNTMFVVSLLSIIFAIIFAVLFLIDINKSHRYRMQLEQSNKRITDLLSYREMLMLTISHDIKAPTGSILGYIDLMIEEKDNKKSNFYLQNIKLSAQNVLQLVSTLLDFHKLDKGGWQLQESEFSLYSLIEESTNSFKPLADKKGLEFKVENKIPEGMLCFGDNYVLWHIFSNLISNAVKYTSHGQITILANTHETDSKTVLNFAVADTGEGIDIEDQEDIFNEFKQFIKNNNKGEHVEGSGLGLAITKGFVKVVNGEISFTSTKGEGSEFVVEIPLNVITDRDKDRKGFSKYDDLKDVSMLYVDDDPVQLKMMSEIVQKKEINCTTESNPDNVLGIIDSNNFDIILIDIQLGDKSGFDLVRSVNEKLRDQNVEIPVLALSARSDISISMIQAAGFKDFISKPFNFNQLYEKISKYINSSFINSSEDYNLKLNGVSALIEFVKDDIDASSEIQKSFINETKESELILKNAIKDNDFVSISKISHKMLPLFRMIGHEKVVGIMEQYRGP